MAPLLDVVFLLLTFFIFSVVLMERAPKLLGIELPSLDQAAQPPQRADIIAITIDAEGLISVNAQPIWDDQTTTPPPTITPEFVAPFLKQALERASADIPNPRYVLAADIQSRSGTLMATIDTLHAMGITDFALAGRRDQQSTTNAPPQQPKPPAQQTPQ